MSLGKDAQRGKDYLPPVGEHVVVELSNRKETLQGTFQNVEFHEDGTIAALLVEAGRSAYVPWHSGARQGSRFRF